MANYSFTVDTHPMAQSLTVVSNGVNGVSKAVVAMETAVVAAEEEAARQVCNKLDNGFFLLIRSQISQKAAHLQSAATAKLMTLRQLAIALDAIKRQMERDYHMICGRYKKLFRSLDKSLQQRVFELDKMPSDLATKHYPNLIGRLRNSGSGFIMNQGEIVPLGQFALTAKVRTNTDTLIGSISANLREQANINTKLNYCLNKESIRDTQCVSIPVLYSELEAVSGFGSYTEVNTPHFSGNLSSAESKIQQAVTGLVDTWKWQNITHDEKAKILRELEAMGFQNNLAPRIQAEMMKLANSNNWHSPVRKDI